MWLVSTAYAVLGACVSLVLADTLWRFPLRDVARRYGEDAAWLRAWLRMTVVDYYGAALVLGGVAVRDRGWAEGAAWAAGFAVLGAPACCAYAAAHLWRK